MLEPETGVEKLEERRKSPEEQNSYLSQKLDRMPEEIMLMLRDLRIPVGRLTQATAEDKTDWSAVRDTELRKREGFRKITIRLSKTGLRLSALKSIQHLKLVLPANTVTKRCP